MLNSTNFNWNFKTIHRHNLLLQINARYYATYSATICPTAVTAAEAAINLTVDDESTATRKVDTIDLRL
jgi:hypothetical protein